MNKTRVRIFMSLLSFVLLIGCILLLALVDVPEVNAPVLNILIGAFSTCFITIISYYFGDVDGK